MKWKRLKTYTWPPKCCFQKAFFTLRKSAFNNQGNWILSSNSSSWIDPLYIATTFKREEFDEAIINGPKSYVGARRNVPFFTFLQCCQLYLYDQNRKFSFNIWTNFGNKKFSTNWRRRHYVQVWPKLKFCNFFKNCQKSGTLCLLN